jgi:type IV pilus assembly protein PilB
MAKSAKRIGEILIEKGFITEAQLHDALTEQKLSDKFLGKILVDKGVIADRDLIAALAEQFGMSVVELKEQHIDMELARKFSTSLIIDHKCFPLKEDDYSVTMAIINPLNAVAISKIEDEAHPRKVNLVLVAEEDINKIIQNYRRYISESIQRLLKRKTTEGGR